MNISGLHPIDFLYIGRYYIYDSDYYTMNMFYFWKLWFLGWRTSIILIFLL